MLRIDSTVTAALMHEPSDSALLWDAVRLMTRLLRQAAALPGAPLMRWPDRRRMAKRCATEIQYSRGNDNRRRLYRKLVAAVHATRAALQRAADRLAELTGIPAEPWRFQPMLDRHIARCGTPPRQMAADGGYASRDNLNEAKGRGVVDVAFHKKRGLAVADMTKSTWVYRKLRNFRAGIEAGISCFKRAYGGRRCTWRGLDRFKAYVWSAVVAHNLVLFARLKPA